MMPSPENFTSTQTRPRAFKGENESDHPMTPPTQSPEPWPENPLPWRVSSNPGGPGNQPAFPGIDDATDRPHGANIVAACLGSSEQCKANSTFIAHAVNSHARLESESQRLREVLDSILKQYTAAEAGDFDWDKFDETIQEARAVLRKAQMKTEITEADVCAWLQNRLLKIQATGLPATSLAIHANSTETNWTLHGGGECATLEPTSESAVTHLRAKIGNPDDLAASKRANAARLIAEAEELEKGGAV